MKLHITLNKKSVAWLSLISIPHNGHLEIEYLMVEKDFRGKGYASKLIDTAKRVANTIPLVCFIEPHPDSSLTYQQECEWLASKGFVKQDDYDFGGYKKDVMIFKMNY